MKSKKHQTDRAQAAFLSDLAFMNARDTYRLRFNHPPPNLPPDIQTALNSLYNQNTTQVLIATLIDGILSHRESVFLLSRDDCQRLLDSNPKIGSKVSLTGGHTNRAYAGAIAELEHGRGMITITIAASNKPMVIEVISPFILGIIGESNDGYRMRVYQSVGLTPQVSVVSNQKSVVRRQVSEVQVSGVQESEVSGQESGVSSQGKRALNRAQQKAQQKLSDDMGDF